MQEPGAPSEVHDILSTIVHPAIFDTNDLDYRFSGVGTVFLAQYNENFYGITARHVIKNQQYSVEQLRVFVKGYDYTLPFDQEITLPDENEDKYDITILRLNSKILASNPPPPLGVVNLNLIPVPEANPPEDSILLCCGYPECQRSYDYDEKLFQAGLARFEGTPAGSLTEDICLMRTDLHFIGSARGLSGSPVFGIHENIPFFAGMVLRSTKESNNICYLQGAVILELLERATRLYPSLDD